MPKMMKEESIVTVSEIKMDEMQFNLLGITALMPHSASAHAKGQLLFPSPKKNAAERATSMKHEPFDEYREAAYQFDDNEAGATRLYMPAAAIKAAIRDVAIDMIGTKKAQIGRLTTVVGGKLPLYGVPCIHSMLVRSSDMNKTPDVRTLPALKRWAIPGVRVRFVNSLIKNTSMANLIANGGIIIGIGDGRPQHGYFDFGMWRCVPDDDRELKEIMRLGGRKAQEAALADPEFYDLETEKLLRWFEAEKKRRSAAPPPQPKAARKVPPAEVIAAAKANGRKKARDHVET